MNDQTTNDDMDKSTWAVGGGFMLGLGVGFFFLAHSALYFVGSIVAGIGVGLIASSLISKIK